MWWAWELSESRKCVMEVVVVVVVVRYGGLCLESFSASVGDDPPTSPSFPNWRSRRRGACSSKN